MKIIIIFLLVITQTCKAHTNCFFTNCKRGDSVITSVTYSYKIPACETKQISNYIATTFTYVNFYKLKYNHSPNFDLSTLEPILDQRTNKILFKLRQDANVTSLQDAYEHCINIEPNINLSILQSKKNSLIALVKREDSNSQYWISKLHLERVQY